MAAADVVFSQLRIRVARDPSLVVGSRSCVPSQATLYHPCLIWVRCSTLRDGKGLACHCWRPYIWYRLLHYLARRRVEDCGALTDERLVMQGVPVLATNGFPMDELVCHLPGCRTSLSCIRMSATIQSGIAIWVWQVVHGHNGWLVNASLEGSFHMTPHWEVRGLARRPRRSRSGAACKT
jgi:hypothetical protein